MSVQKESDQMSLGDISLIARRMNVPEQEISAISVLKKGMTNRSYVFTCHDKRYIIRIPGEGTDRLINRMQEAQVYRRISGMGLCDDPVYIDPNSGYKITEFLEGVRTCNPLNIADIKKCMKCLRGFHEMKLEVNHEFDIFGQIEFYETLWAGNPSKNRDYQETKGNVLSLKPYIDSHISEKVLTHIDAVPDNFLFFDRGRGEELQLTDWEYAGMQDPHVDIAMFCIYAFYNKQQVDRLISIYFRDACPDEIKVKIYCYIAACGLLWSNWSEYKSSLGVRFGEYGARQYQYAKTYYKIAAEEMKHFGMEKQCDRKRNEAQAN